VSGLRKELKNIVAKNGDIMADSKAYREYKSFFCTTKSALILATVEGFLYQFERSNVRILQNMGYTVHYASNKREILYHHEKDALEKMNVIFHHINIERSPYMYRNNKKAYQALKEIIEENAISLLHCHEPVGGLLGRLAGMHFGRAKLKIIYTVHGFHFFKGAPLINNTAYYMVEKFLARYTDVLVTINEEDYRAGRKLRLRKGGKNYWIPGVGIDLKRFHPPKQEDRERERCRLGIAKDVFHIGTVGEINENKNQVVVIEAMADIVKKYPNRKIIYTIWGEGFFYNVVEDLIEKHQLQNQVMLRGYAADVTKILQTLDLFIFPSRREGLGMAAIEALAMGVPVVSGDNRGTREYMRDEVNGLICPANSKEEYIENILKYANKDEIKKKRMSLAARESIMRFREENTKCIMEDVYHELLQ